MTHYRSGKPPEEWYEKRFISIEKVRPFVQWLEKVYGGLPQVAEVTEVPYRTLQGIRDPGKHSRTTKAVALKIVEAVSRLRYGDRKWSTYENEVPPRYATEEEKSLPQNFSRWRAAGGKVIK